MNWFRACMLALITIFTADLLLGAEVPQVTARATVVSLPLRGEYRLTVQAVVPRGYHIFSINQRPGGPLPTILELNQSSNLVATSQWRESPRPKTERYDFWPGVDVETLSGTVTWTITLRELERREVLAIMGTLIVFPCSDTTCLNPQEIKFQVVR